MGSSISSWPSAVEAIQPSCSRFDCRSDLLGSCQRGGGCCRLWIDRLGGRLRFNSPRLEIADKILPWELEKAHAVRHRFLQSASVVPPVMLDAIGSDHGP